MDPRPPPKNAPEPPEHDPPYPPLELVYRDGSLRQFDDLWPSYESTGAGSKQRIVESLPADWSFEGKRVLDFGCGAGRSLRHFTAEAEAGVGEFFGCDIDEPSIEWMQANLCPPLNAFVNEELPPLPHPDRSFDLIYAISVFDHLTEHWGPWLLELRRLLAEDGYLIVTFLGPERAERVLPSAIAGPAIDPDRTGMNELSHGRPWDRGGPQVVHSRWWIESHWGRAFEIVELQEQGFAPDWDHGYAVMRARAGELGGEDLRAPDPSDPRELAALRENVDQLGRQVTGLWERIDELRGRQEPLRERLEMMREARERERDRYERLELRFLDLKQRRAGAAEDPYE